MSGGVLFAKPSPGRKQGIAGSSPDEVVKGTLHRAGQGQQFSDQIPILRDAPMGIGAPQELGLFRVIRGSNPNTVFCIFNGGGTPIHFPYCSVN